LYDETPMKIYLETLGCQMNRLDSELVRSHLAAAGYELTDDAAIADVVLYNTCSVRQHAEDKVHSRLAADGQRKSSGKTLIVGILGCMAQNEGQGLLDRHPHVDIICAPGQLHRLAEFIADAQMGLPTVAVDPDRKEHPKPTGDEVIDTLDLSRDPDNAPSSAQAFVRVMKGCDKFCTYCIVPFTRGPEISREPQHIIDEVRRLADAGRSEITLLGQTVNSYRFTRGEATTRFSDLLMMLSPITGLKRLRFVTSHPIDFGDDVLHAMADLPNVCPYLHCPAQSGSDAMLKAMNRKYTRAEYDAFVDRAYAIVPELSIAGDFIVGFPGESEADHQASADLIRRSRYKNAFIFKYSPRPGTVAAKILTDDVDNAAKKRRNNELLTIQNEMSLAHNRDRIGRVMEVLVEGPSKRADRQPTPAPDGEIQLIGRTTGDHIVVFDGPPMLAGQYVDVNIVDATALTLFGKR
jgi:tRNA-2-methylthio-N6-dimethylallyladenosine synthase